MHVGIDLGTTYSAVARLDSESGRPRIIENSAGESLTPSVVAFTPDGGWVHGVDAKQMQESGHTEVASFFKRQMGDPNYRLIFYGKSYSPIDLSALLLRGLVDEAERETGEAVEDVVITVPAYFTSIEREATLTAAQQAGLNVSALVNEPTAAAFAQGVTEQQGSRTILIYDLGGGTFDVTLARVNNDEIQVLGSDGSHALGGKDWDDALAGWVMQEYEEIHGVDLSDDPEQIEQIMVAVEEAKKRLSTLPSTTLTIDHAAGRERFKVTREDFDSLTSFMLQETKDVIARLFQSFEPEMSWSDVDGVVLVGGSTKMKQVSSYLEESVGAPPYRGVNPDEAVALGAAIRANQDARGKAKASRFTLGAAPAPTAGPQFTLPVGKRLSDATSHALGMVSVSEDGQRYITDILIPKNSPVPAERTVRRQMRIPKKDARLEVYLLQGQEERPADNEMSGLYVFTGFRHRGDGEIEVDVTYKYDDNAVIQIEARQVGQSKPLKLHREELPADMSWLDQPPAMQAAAQPIEIYLACDLSGSMGGTFGDVERAMDTLVNQLPFPNAWVGTIGFANKSAVFGQATNHPRKVFQQIRAFKREFDSNSLGGGNSADPLVLLQEWGLYREENALKIAVILTDGHWYTDTDPVEQARRCNALGIETVAVGFGHADLAFLKSISSLPDLASLTDAQGLVSSFSAIAQVLTGGSTELSM